MLNYYYYYYYAFFFSFSFFKYFGSLPSDRIKVSQGEI